MKKRMLLSLIGLLIGQLISGMDLDPDLSKQEEKENLLCNQANKKEKQLAHIQRNTFFNSIQPTFVPSEVQAHIAQFMLKDVLYDYVLEKEILKDEVDIYSNENPPNELLIAFYNLQKYGSSKYDKLIDGIIQYCSEKNILHQYDGSKIKTRLFNNDKTLKLEIVNMQSGELVADDVQGTIKIWDATEKCICELKHGDYLVSASLNHDGSLAATGSIDGTVKVWDIKTKECIYTFKHGSELDQVGFFDDSVITWTSYGIVKKWDLFQEKLLQWLRNEHDQNNKLSIEFAHVIKYLHQERIKK